MNPLTFFKLLPTKYIVLALVISNLLMVSLWLWEKNAHKDTLSALDNFTNEVATERKVQEAENRLKDIAGRKEANRINREKLAMLKQLDLADLDKEKLLSEVKRHYENYQQSQMAYDRTYRNFNERLRIEANRNEIATTQEPTAPGYTGTWQEHDPTFIRDIIQACQITTIDLNTCSAWVDAACEKVGCE